MNEDNNRTWVRLSGRLYLRSANQQPASGTNQRWRHHFLEKQNSNILDRGVPWFSLFIISLHLMYTHVFVFSTGIITSSNKFWSFSSKVYFGYILQHSELTYLMHAWTCLNVKFTLKSNLEICGRRENFKTNIKTLTLFIINLGLLFWPHFKWADVWWSSFLLYWEMVSEQIHSLRNVL